MTAPVVLVDLLSQIIFIVISILSEIAVFRKQLADHHQQMASWGDQLD
jgi:hypothetical protein